MAAVHRNHPADCRGPTRREVLRVGGLGAMGLSLSGLLAGRAAADPPGAASRSFGRAKACILLWMSGGPPQHDTWDPKPDAPAEIRGELTSLPTTVPGLRVGELMPLTARRMESLCAIRSLSTGDNAHTSSGYWMLTGYRHPKGSGESLPVGSHDWPCLGAVVKKFRPAARDLPAAIQLPEPIYNDPHVIWPGQNAGVLGRAFDPWQLECDPSSADFQIDELRLPADVPLPRLERRRHLLDEVNRTLEASSASVLAGHDTFTRQSLDLLSGRRVRGALDLAREPAKVRDRYGAGKWGQCVLLARRLVEAGVPLVQVNWPRDKRSAAGSPVWDIHNDGYKPLKSILMPLMDQGFSALLDDLKERGLLDSTLVVWVGEFGRTPRLKPGGGRDHWGPVFSGALAGGGIRGGQAYGASDRDGAHPKDNMVQPPDLTATIFHCLGLDPRTEITDRFNRPFPISNGRVLERLF